MKLSRRDFLKYLAVIGSFAPFFNIENIKANIADFSFEQLESISEIRSIKKAEWSPYYVPRSVDFGYYDIELKDGSKVCLDTVEIKERYGGILGYLIEHGQGDLKIDNSKRIANWND